jgi:hypothetical protein
LSAQSDQLIDRFPEEEGITLLADLCSSDEVERIAVFKRTGFCLLSNPFPTTKEAFLTQTRLAADIGGLVQATRKLLAQARRDSLETITIEWENGMYLIFEMATSRNNSVVVGMCLSNTKRGRIQAIVKRTRQKLAVLNWDGWY